MTAAATDEHDQLRAFLRADPHNLELLADAADAAYRAGRYAESRDLLDRHASLQPLPPGLLHLSGLIALAEGDWTGAAARFEAVQAVGEYGPALRYNLGWSLAMVGRKEEALGLVDEAAADALPQAAQLRIGLLHEAGELDTALAAAHAGLARFPDHQGLNAAISTLAVDMGDLALAQRAAAQAGDHPDALVTLGTLTLGDGDAARARQLFEAALAATPGSARAWVGRGLAGLGNDCRQAAADLDKGAELFGSHLGSWVAAGWAHYLAGDLDAAAARFDRARIIDPSFAEAQGSLAVIAAVRGERDEASRLAEVALRLDRRSFAGALATALLAAGSGDAVQADRIVSMALNTPVDDTGTTIAAALAKMGTTRG